MAAQLDQILTQAVNDPDLIETQEWLDALESVIENEGPERAHYLMERMVDLARQRLGEDADVHVADLNAPLPFADAEFDDAGSPTCERSERRERTCAVGVACHRVRDEHRTPGRERARKSAGGVSQRRDPPLARCPCPCRLGHLRSRSRRRRSQARQRAVAAARARARTRWPG